MNLNDIHKSVGFSDDLCNDIIASVKFLESNKWKIDEVQARQRNAGESIVSVSLEPKEDPNSNIRIYILIKGNDNKPAISVAVYSLDHDKRKEVKVKKSILSFVKKNLDLFTHRSEWNMIKEYIESKTNMNTNKMNIEKLIEKTLKENKIEDNSKKLSEGMYAKSMVAKLVSSLNAFRKAARELEEDIVEAENIFNDDHAWLKDGYPLEASFDDFTYDVYKWVDKCFANLKK